VTVRPSSRYSAFHDPSNPDPSANFALDLTFGTVNPMCADAIAAPIEYGGDRLADGRVVLDEQHADPLLRTLMDRNPGIRPTGTA
jgi:hypothetical protein